jgi:N-acylglucosamine-6-phosphate 2-epimerase
MTPSHPTLTKLHGGLIVSCQARPGSPLRDVRMIAAMAQCAERGGAAGVRIDGPDDIAAVRRSVAFPIIGIQKIAGGPVYITPTFDAARQVVRAGADIVAIQATRERAGTTDPLGPLIARVHEELAAPVMADVSTLDEGIQAAEAGADLVATTMSGYTPHSPSMEGPDLTLIEELAGRLTIPVVAEGRISTPEEARAALHAGAWAVVVGRAITMPEAITERFVKALAGGARSAGESNA